MSILKMSYCYLAFRTNVLLNLCCPGHLSYYSPNESEPLIACFTLAAGDSDSRAAYHASHIFLLSYLIQTAEAVKSIQYININRVGPVIHDVCWSPSPILILVIMHYKAQSIKQPNNSNHVLYKAQCIHTCIWCSKLNFQAKHLWPCTFTQKI